MNGEQSLYPALYRASDAAAQRFRKLFLWTHKCQLVSLAVGGLAGAFSLGGGAALSAWVYGIVAVSLFAGFILALISRAMAYEALWFDCRAISESIKTATWRYVSKAPPFDEEKEPVARFLQELKRIRHARPEATSHLGALLDASGAEITVQMADMRNAALEQRVAVYVEHRIHNQRLWYTTQANHHAHSAAFWLWAVLGMQALAVVAAVVIAIWGRRPYDIIAMLTTLAAIGVAWDRGRRNSELSRSYSLSAQELSASEALAAEVPVDKAFARLVEQVEGAISQEHTLWCAQRDLPQSG